MTSAGFSFPIVLLLCFFSSTNALQVLHCGPNMYCFPHTHRIWQEWKMVAQQLIDLETTVQQVGGDAFISNTTANMELLEKKSKLCKDELSSGFLLDEDAGNTTNSCLWTGSELSVACVPVPQQYKTKPFHYILHTQWRTKIRNFRKRIGCTSADMLAIEQIEELYICNERCIQGGISYLASLLMLICLSIAFIRNCLL